MEVTYFEQPKKNLKHSANFFFQEDLFLAQVLTLSSLFASQIMQFILGFACNRIEKVQKGSCCSTIESRVYPGISGEEQNSQLLSFSHNIET